MLAITEVDHCPLVGSKAGVPDAASLRAAFRASVLPISGVVVVQFRLCDVLERWEYADPGFDFWDDDSVRRIVASGVREILARVYPGSEIDAPLVLVPRRNSP